MFSRTYENCSSVSNYNSFAICSAELKAFVLFWIYNKQLMSCYVVLK